VALLFRGLIFSSMRCILQEGFTNRTTMALADG
jgi:hypothetical protein